MFKEKLLKCTKNCLRKMVTIYPLLKISVSSTYRSNAFVEEKAEQFHKMME